MLAYMGSGTGFIQTYFLLALPVSLDTKLNENIIQVLPPN